MYREGYGVYVIPIWDGEDEDRIAEIEVGVVQLGPTNEHIIGGALCARNEDGFYFPMGNFEELDDLRFDDTHDLRDRWFATRVEADEHAAYTRNRWDNPAPWESFVQVS